jgi:hypothetical protein
VFGLDGVLDKLPGILRVIIETLSPKVTVSIALALYLQSVENPFAFGFDTVVSFAYVGLSLCVVIISYQVPITLFRYYL